MTRDDRRKKAAPPPLKPPPPPPHRLRSQAGLAFFHLSSFFSSSSDGASGCNLLLYVGCAAGRRSSLAKCGPTTTVALPPRPPFPARHPPRRAAAPRRVLATLRPQPHPSRRSRPSSPSFAAGLRVSRSRRSGNWRVFCCARTHRWRPSRWGRMRALVLRCPDRASGCRRRRSQASMPRAALRRGRSTLMRPLFYACFSRSARIWNRPCVPSFPPRRNPATSRRDAQRRSTQI